MDFSGTKLLSAATASRTPWAEMPKKHQHDFFPLPSPRIHVWMQRAWLLCWQAMYMYYVSQADLGVLEVTTTHADETSRVSRDEASHCEPWWEIAVTWALRVSWECGLAQPVSRPVSCVYGGVWGWTYGDGDGGGGTVCVCVYVFGGGSCIVLYVYRDGGQQDRANCPRSLSCHVFGLMGGGENVMCESLSNCFYSTYPFQPINNCSSLR